MNKKILTILFLLCICTVAMAQHRSMHYGLGAGGTQYSSMSHRRLQANNGLHTGQYGGQHFLFGFYLEGGYSRTLQSSSFVQNAPGGGVAGMGMVFEYQRDIFILQVGAGLRVQAIANNVNDTSFTRFGVKDTWSYRDGYLADVKYDFYQRRDVAQNVYFEIPLLMGSSFGGGDTRFGRGYFLVGPKLHYAFAGRTSLSAVGTTTATYDRYIGIFEEMDNHGMRKDVAIERNGDRLKLKLDLLAHAEIGWEKANPSRRGSKYSYRKRYFTNWRLRVAAFAEVGVLDICPETGRGLCRIPAEKPYDFCDFDFNHAFSTSDFASKTLHNLFVGVKLSVLIGAESTEQCIICDWQSDYRDERNPGYNRKQPNSYH